LKEKPGLGAKFKEGALSHRGFLGGNNLGPLGDFEKGSESVCTFFSPGSVGALLFVL